jgi:hypothetical protein
MDKFSIVYLVQISLATIAMWAAVASALATIVSYLVSRDSDLSLFFAIVTIVLIVIMGVFIVLGI